MREGWKVYRLGEIVDLKQGFALNKKSNHYLAKDDNGLPLLKISDLINGTETLFVNQDIPKQFLVTPSEIIYSRTGQVGLAFMGKTGVVYNNCFKVIPGEKVYSVFLYQWLNTDFIRRTISSLATGAAQPDLNHGAFKSVKINLPPLPTQQKIAHILSAYDDLIENNLRRIKLLEEKAQLTYEEWFVRMKFPGHETAVFDEGTGLPNKWRWTKLNEVVDLIKDSVYPDHLDQVVPYIGLEHIPRKSITLNVWETSEKVDSLKYRYRKSDILFGKIRPYFHKVGIALNEGITSTDTIVLRPKTKLIHGIVLQTVFSDHFVDSATQSSNGTKMPRANWNVLKKYPVLIPEEGLQSKYQLLASTIVKELEILVRKNQLLKEARDLLLPRLMTGMIDVEGVKVGEG